MKDWIMELCPEIAEWQAELIAEQAEKDIRTAIEQALSARVPTVDWETRAEMAEQQVVCLSEERDHLKAMLRAAAPQPPAQETRVPEGWRLVPVEATTAMADAGGSAVRTCYRKEYGDRKPGEVMCNYVYRAMLNAAPQPPAQREWVGLTDEEIGDIQRSSLVFSAYSSKAFARAIEAKLREKNGGAA